MTTENPTEARDDLITRSHQLEKAANSKLRMPTNVAKGDGWKDETLFDLILKLCEEVEEFKFAAIAIETNEMNSTARDMFATALLLEGGDVINLMRMICDRARVI